MHIRRVVTVNNSEGKSGVLFDGPPPNTLEPFAGVKASDLWETTSPPVDLASSQDRAARAMSLVPPSKGTIVKLLTLPPANTLPASFWADIYAQSKAPVGSHSGTGMHQTNTVDYVICIEGEVHCVLDLDVVCLRSGDILIQQGTNHAWENRSNKSCTFLGVLVDNG